MVKTPVLFETFVRDDYARQVFDVIKKAQPQKLYFYSNKGRNRDNEIELNNNIRSWTNEIDWDCELHTFFRNECVDVYTSLKGAVDWVFETEDCVIVLEDDVVPSLAFFDFCDQMIEKFKNDRRVWHVSGDNFGNYNPSGYDYIFSRYHWMYGWATWKDRWECVPWENPQIEKFVKSRIYRQLYKTKRQAKYQEEEILGLCDFLSRTKCWDYLFGLAADQNNSCGVFPKQHLITNIGLSGTHHKKSIKTFVNNETSYKGNRYIIEKEPPFVFADIEYDYLCFKMRFTLRNRIRLLIRNFILKIFGKNGLEKIKNVIHSLLK